MDIKRFEIVPILESIRVKEKTAFQLTCVEVNNNDIYIGTADSFILYFRNVLENIIVTTFSSTPDYRYISSRKEITQLRAAAVLNQLLVITDNTLIALNLNTLEICNNLRVKNVSAFCLNENPISMDPFSIEICLVKKKSICVCQLQSDKIVMLKEISVPEQPILVSMDGYFVCTATNSNYYMIDWKTDTSTLLCSNDASSFMKPICQFVARNEFLINGLSHLGIFVKTSGISEKPPIDWGMDVHTIAYSYPYILCLKKFSISIISVIDSKLKEELLFNDGVYIDNFDGKILVASNDSVFLLRRIPWEEQINSLLENGKSQEAIDLCATLYESGLIAVQDLDYSKLVKVKAGLIELSQDNFNLALQYLIESEFDLEIFLNCCPNITPYFQFEPEESEFMRTNLNQIKLKIHSNLSHYVSFLIDYIERLINQNKFLYTSNAIKFNSCLLILYLEDISKNLSSIKQFFRNDSKYDQKCIERYLNDLKQYHLLAFMYSCNVDSLENAIDIWVKLENGSLKDPLYDGHINISHLLENCKNAKLIINRIEFLLERDPEEASKVLISNTKVENEKFVILDPEQVISILQGHRSALIIYLEYLVFNLKVKNPHIHNSLALIYIEIISLQQETEEEKSTFCKCILQKLRNLLQNSNSYDTNTILKSLLKYGLNYEAGFLYGKLGNHSKAFEIYICQYMDYDKALKHCLEYSINTNAREMYHTLLGVYLEQYHRNGPEIMKPLLNFLNHSMSQFDFFETLKLLPPEWPIYSLRPFLLNNVRAQYSCKFQSSMDRTLSKSQLQRIKQEKQTLTRRPIFVDQQKVCIICNTKLYDANFVWVPSSECYLHDYCYSNL